MKKNYYKQSRQQSYISTKKRACEYNYNLRSKSKSPANKQKSQSIQSNSKFTSIYKMAIGELKYFQECFPEEYTTLSINNEIYFEKELIKCMQKDSLMNTTLEGSSDEDQTQLQDFNLQTSFNPINYTQYQHSSRFVYSNRERIFEERRTSLSPLQRSLYCRHNSQLQSSKKKIFD